MSGTASMARRRRKYYRDDKRHREDEVENETTIEGKGMTGNRTSHITVTYRDIFDAAATCIYAVNEDISRELDRRMVKPTGRALKEWLEKEGCRLDSSGGPAFIWRFEDGTIYEQYYRSGELHREDGPAIVKRYADGSNYEEYYRDGKKHREDGPAYVWRNANGSTVERYYRDGKKHSEDGTADGFFEKR
jgi:hypothetical protein